MPHLPKKKVKKKTEDKEIKNSKNKIKNKNQTKEKKKSSLTSSLGAVLEQTYMKQITKTANIIFHLTATIKNSHCLYGEKNKHASLKR